MTIRHHYLDIPDDEYYSSYNEYCSASRLNDFKAMGPSKFHALVTGEDDRPKSKSLIFGAAFHTRVLEGEQAFHDRFIEEDPPVNPKTGEPYKTGIKVQQWLDSAPDGVEFITLEESAKIANMNFAIRNHDVASELLTNGDAEKVLRQTLCGVECQSKLDYIRPDYHQIIDLKTTQSLDTFEDWITRKYLFQMSFYRMMVRKACNHNFAVTLIAIEKEPPYEIGIWEITPQSLELTDADVMAQLQYYRWCRGNDKWPSKYPEVTKI
jgi:hypothetical protein